MDIAVKAARISRVYRQTTLQFLGVGLALVIVISLAKNVQSVSVSTFSKPSFRSLLMRSPEGPYDRMIADVAQEYRVDPHLIRAIIQVESQFNERCRSSAGAKGLMQLMPATARWMGVKNIWDPRDNVRGGTQYLKTLLDRYHGDLRLTLAAYNAGHMLVDRLGDVPDYPETRAFVRAVTRLYDRSRLS